MLNDYSKPGICYLAGRDAKQFVQGLESHGELYRAFSRTVPPVLLGV